MWLGNGNPFLFSERTKAIPSMRGRDENCDFYMVKDRIIVRRFSRRVGHFLALASA